MFIYEFLLVFLVSLSAFYTFLTTLRITRKSPILESKLFSLAFLSVTIGFLVILPSTILYNPNYIDPIGEHFHRLSFIFDMLALALFSMAFILPTFKASLRSFFEIMSFMVVCSATAVINYFELLHFPASNRVGVNYSYVGLISFSFGILLLIYFLIQRLREIQQVLSKSGEKMETINPFSSIIIITLGINLFLVSIFAIITQIFTESPFPTFTLFLPMAIAIFLIGYVVTKNSAFFFITSAKLERISVINKQTGEEIIFRDYIEFKDTNGIKNQNEKISLSRTFQLLDLSIQQIVQSEKGIEEISLGDKIISSAPGKNITTLLIISEGNLITQSINRYLTKEFEKFYSLNEKFNNIHNHFNNLIDEIRPFIPL